MSRNRFVITMILIGLFLVLTGVAFGADQAAEATAKASTTPWWVWPLSLFLVTFVEKASVCELFG